MKVSELPAHLVSPGKGKAVRTECFQSRSPAPSGFCMPYPPGLSPDNIKQEKMRKHTGICDAGCHDFQMHSG